MLGDANGHMNAEGKPRRHPAAISG